MSEEVKKKCARIILLEIEESMRERFQYRDLKNKIVYSQDDLAFYNCYANVWTALSQPPFAK